MGAAQLHPHWGAGSGPLKPLFTFCEEEDQIVSGEFVTSNHNSLLCLLHLVLGKSQAQPLCGRSWVIRRWRHLQAWSLLLSRNSLEKGIPDRNVLQNSFKGRLSWTIHHSLLRVQQRSGPRAFSSSSRDTINMPHDQRPARTIWVLNKRCSPPTDCSAIAAGKLFTETLHWVIS